MDNPERVKALKELKFGDSHFADALNSLMADSELESALESELNNNLTDNFYDDTEYLDYLAYFKK